MPNFIEGGGVVLVHNYGMIVWKTPEEAEKMARGIEYLMNYHVKLLMIKGAKSLLYEMFVMSLQVNKQMKAF